MIDFAHYQALTFDCYGTLIDWETGLTSILVNWLERHELNLSSEEVLEAFGHAEAQLQLRYPSLKYPKILKLVLCDLAEKYRVTADQDLQEELACSVGLWHPFPDSAAALHSLRRFYKLVIISNVDHASFSRSREQLGVDFDLVVTAEDVGSYKPNLRNFDVALQQLAGLGVSQDRVLHVAQSLYHDHEPAQRQGLTSVLIDRRRGKAGTGAVARTQQPIQVDAVYGSMAEFVADVERALTSTPGSA